MACVVVGNTSDVVLSSFFSHLCSEEATGACLACSCFIHGGAVCPCHSSLCSLFPVPSCLPFRHPPSRGIQHTDRGSCVLVLGSGGKKGAEREEIKYDGIAM